MRGFLVACAPLLGWTGSASAQPGGKAPPDFVMHRVQVSNPDASGTSLAESTDGGFSVRMPIPFNDFTLFETKGAVSRICTIGGKTPGGLKLAAVRASYREPGKIKELLPNAKKGIPGLAISGVTDVTFKSWPGVDFVATDGRTTLWSRTLLLGDDAMMLTIEAPPSMKKTAERLVQPFFNSLKVDGECASQGVS